MYRLETFYKTKAWEDLRKRLMMERVNEDGQLICEHCGKPILKAYDCIGHHKIELTEENVNDINVSLNPDNIMLIHYRCHNEEHERFDGLHQQVFLVHGSPCSGKTTFVRMNANKDDLVVDQDAIFQAISFCDPHEHPKRVKAVAFAVRTAILEAIKIRHGTWRNAWIISSKTGLDLDRDADAFRARLIHIDTPKDECIKRLKASPHGRDVKAWETYIEDYWERYEAAAGSASEGRA